MTNKEAAERIREWAKTPAGPFSWPTDGCGYEQHIRFVKHRNEHWSEVADSITFEQFALDYANMLDAEER